ncbi:hypothetical protein BU230_18690, partial [Klebsiella pneumoniae]
PRYTGEASSAASNVYKRQGLLCSVVGMITKRKSRKYALWACSLFVFMLLFTVFGFMLGWMISFGP